MQPTCIIELKGFYFLGKGGFPFGLQRGQCWQFGVRICPWKKWRACLLLAECEVITNTKAFAPSGHVRKRVLECSWQNQDTLGCLCHWNAEKNLVSPLPSEDTIAFHVVSTKCVWSPKSPSFPCGQHLSVMSKIECQIRL